MDTIDKNEEVIEQDVEETQVETENDESKAPETETKKFEEDLDAKYARLKRQTEQLAKKLGKNDFESPKPSKKSDDFGYDVKAFLTANGIKGSKEFEFVKNEVKKSGQDIESLLENEYFQHRLNNFRELTKTSEATIKGTRSGGVPTDSVDYWLSKPIEQVPKEMLPKVVKAKREQSKDKGVFYNS